jgi:isoquinoline 1-oxidoreductase beta subunit
MVFARPKLPPTRHQSKVISVNDRAAKKPSKAICAA